jgi:hypothetical protein
MILQEQLLFSSHCQRDCDPEERVNLAFKYLADQKRVTLFHGAFLLTI